MSNLAVEAMKAFDEESKIHRCDAENETALRNLADGMFIRGMNYAEKRAEKLREREANQATIEISSQRILHEGYDGRFEGYILNGSTRVNIIYVPRHDTSGYYNGTLFCCSLEEAKVELRKKYDHWLNGTIPIEDSKNKNLFGD